MDQSQQIDSTAIKLMSTQFIKHKITEELAQNPTFCNVSMDVTYTKNAPKEFMCIATLSDEHNIPSTKFKFWFSVLDVIEFIVTKMYTAEGIDLSQY